MNVVKKSSALAAVLIGMFAGTAHAQSGMIARVPFAFVVHGRELPAGRYIVSREEGALEIVSLDTDRPSAVFAIMIPTGGVDPADRQPALVFLKRENEYVLSQVWESQTEGFEVPSRLGGRLAKAARSSLEEAAVVVAANWK